MKKAALLIVPEKPGFTNGYGRAISSDLIVYKSNYDTIEVIVMNDSPVSNFEFVSASNAPKWMRFIRSIFSGIPAIAVKYYSERLRKKIIIRYNYLHLKHNVVDLIVTDIPLTQNLLHKDLRFIKNDNIIVRSHNVCADIFENISSSFFYRLIWKYERNKVMRLESEVVRNYKTYAISKSDALRYKELYDVDCHFFAVIQLIERQPLLKIKAPNIQCIGTINLRKLYSIYQLFKGIEIFDGCPIIFIGEGTEKLNISNIKLRAHGKVEDLSPYLEKRHIFLNPQSIGSGLNLKSLFAISNGYLLLSTDFGVEGIPVQHGESFISIDRFTSTYEALMFALGLTDEERLCISNNAKSVLVENFSKPAVISQYQS